MKKMKKKISKMLMAAALTAISMSGISQANLGEVCVCPFVASRPTVNLSTKGTLLSGGSGVDYVLNASVTTLFCDTTYILDGKIYVDNLKTLKIMPGTLIKGNTSGTVGTSTALIVMRGGTIIAKGSASCPIVFTAAADPMDGSYPITNHGKWGGLVILGTATNNLTGSSGIAVETGVGSVEGFSKAVSRNHFGAPAGLADDNDNSGVLQYVSVRHAGTFIVAGNEINGITLGSVGKGTVIDHVEVIASADDGIELFGGNVNLKYITVAFCQDDMIDYDLGYTGKIQFAFGYKTSSADTTTSVDADNGWEVDNDDSRNNGIPRTHPISYNVTLIGNNKKVPTIDNTAIAAICAKENTQGEFYNGVYANFVCGLMLWNQSISNSSRVASTSPAFTDNQRKFVPAAASGLRETKDQFLSGHLIVKNNTFLGTNLPLALDVKGAGTYPGKPGDVVDHTPGAAEQTLFTNSGNLCVAAPATAGGIVYVWSMDPSTNATSVKLSPVPTAALASTITPPNDGFFDNTANYRGAFKANTTPWISHWSYSALIKDCPAMSQCPSDFNKDGKTDASDYLNFQGKFNQTCD